MYTGISRLTNTPPTTPTLESHRTITAAGAHKISIRDQITSHLQYLRWSNTELIQQRERIKFQLLQVERYRVAFNRTMTNNIVLPPKWDLAMTQEKQVNEDLKSIVEDYTKNVMFYKVSRCGWKKTQQQAKTLTATTMHVLGDLRMER
jgi:putative ribosome biogenesis GTPase RsgA